MGANADGVITKDEYKKAMSSLLDDNYKDFNPQEISNASTAQGSSRNSLGMEALLKQDELIKPSDEMVI